MRAARHRHRRARGSRSATTARRTSSTATSSPAATASTASAAPSIPDGRADASTSTTTRSAGSASSPQVAAVLGGADLLPTTSAASRCTACARRELSRLYLQCDPDDDIDELAGRAHLGRAADALARPTTASTLHRGADRREGHHADAQLRGRADAVRAPVPRRRRRAHRAAHRRQGAEPGGRRRHACWPRHWRALYEQRRRRPARRPTRPPACAGSGACSTSPGG